MDKNDVTQYRVAVLAGGWSDEREISLQSGTACAEALREAGFSTVDLLDVADSHFIATLMQAEYDVAFIAMHGQRGEDGCIQGLLEILHIPYTFSGVRASAIASEKDFAKVVCSAVGIEVPRGIEIESKKELSDEDIQTIITTYGLPLIVKPVSNGSSYGVTRVTQKEELRGAIKLAGDKDERILIEECIVGTEITVPVLGNDNPQALPVVEISFESDFYDLKVKYESASLHHIIPSRLNDDVVKLSQKYAVMAHKALGCRGVSRSDFIVTPDGCPVLLETNTIPGMTVSSLLPDSARHAGIEFPELCKTFIELALED